MREEETGGLFWVLVINIVLRSFLLEIEEKEYNLLVILVFYKSNLSNAFFLLFINQKLKKSLSFNTIISVIFFTLRKQERPSH